MNSHRDNAVRGHRTGLNNSRVEKYHRRKTHMWCRRSRLGQLFFSRWQPFGRVTTVLYRYIFICSRSWLLSSGPRCTILAVELLVMLLLCQQNISKPLSAWGREPRARPYGVDAKVLIRVALLQQQHNECIWYLTIIVCISGTYCGCNWRLEPQNWLADWPNKKQCVRRREHNHIITILIIITGPQTIHKHPRTNAPTGRVDRNWTKSGGKAL